MVTICRSLGHIMYPLIFRFNSFYFRVFSLIISLDISPMDMLDHFCQYFISVICIIMLMWWIFSIYLFKYSWFPRCYFCCTVKWCSYTYIDAVFLIFFSIMTYHTSVIDMDGPLFQMRKLTHRDSGWYPVLGPQNGWPTPDSNPTHPPLTSCPKGPSPGLWQET